MILIIILIAHFVGDFYLQTERIAKEKHNNWKFLLKHGIIYAITVAVFIIVSVSISNALWPIIIISVSHYIVDVAKVQLQKLKLLNKYEFELFIADQILHIIIIIVVFFAFNIQQHMGSIAYAVNRHIGDYYLNIIVVYGLVYLIIIKPSAVAIKKLLEKLTGLKDESSSDSENIENAGYAIGVLERVISTTLVLIGQYSAIGFIIAAKSIARYKRITEEAAFAEKYLIGTLSSIAISIIVTLFLMQWIR